MTRLLVVLLGLTAIVVIPLAVEREEPHQLGSGKREVTTVHAAPPPDPCFDYLDLEAGTAERTRQRHFNHLDAVSYARWHGACVYAWGETQWKCWDALGARESDWNHYARNRSSGAYGIPQAVPGHKMASHGTDWRHNPRVQTRWMASYVQERYGSPCTADRFQRTKGWY